MSSGDVYIKNKVWNGWTFRLPNSHRDPCQITISSPVKADKNVKISYAQTVGLAGEVLKSCETGGANTFEGEWRIVVTKDPVPRTLAAGRWLR